LLKEADSQAIDGGRGHEGEAECSSHAAHRGAEDPDEKLMNGSYAYVLGALMMSEKGTTEEGEREIGLQDRHPLYDLAD